MTAVPVTLGSPRFRSREVAGFLVTEARFPARSTLPMHTHDRATVALMLEGSFDCVLPGRVLPCPPGALHTEPAEARHGNRISAAGAHVIVVQPDLDAAQGLGRHRALLDEVNYLPRSAMVAGGWRLVRELYCTDSATDVALEGLVLEFLAEGIRRRESRSGATTPTWLLRSQEFVHAHFTERFRLADIAKVIDVSPVRLARAFRRQFGRSIGDYTRALRLDWAGAALASTDESIAAIAARAGFADQSHFTRAFHAHTGSTPAQFRALSRQ